ncbi:MAG: translation initiation factor 1 [Puniceicoccaceae bacterium 5H]|nr:MAG: translation initiation factor 1 [Puniceicoccaceae bacterium 5H]
MAQGRKRIETDGGDQLQQSAFDGLALGGLAAAPPRRETVDAESPAMNEPARKKPRMRVDVRRVKAGRGGKTVTEVTGFKGLGDRDLQALAQRLKASLGTGGTVRGQALEIQGDRVDAVMERLEAEGFRPVKTGG